MPYRTLDLTQVRTYPLAQRRNLVHLEDLIHPEDPLPPFDDPQLAEVAKCIIQARRAGRPVIWMMGAHVVKSGLSPLVIDLMRKGIITHVAGNGAVSIHDFELALIGQTSEDVATSIEDGSFGMAEETGALMHRAIQQGARDGLGYGESIGRLIAEEERFQYREVSILYQGYKLGVPVTIHVALGTDIIHQHPDCDFAALGWASGQDFRIYCAAVADLEGGVFLNFGSAVIGPEVFLKALSIARNLGYRVERFTTANFDLIDLGEDYHAPVGKDDPHYYYRPRKNIVNRPTSMGGRGYHIVGDHRATIPNLYHRVVTELGETLAREPAGHGPWTLDEALDTIAERCPRAAGALRGLLKRHPELESAAADLARAYVAIARSQAAGGILFLAGNGGSMADALHISGELLKSYKRPRPLAEGLRRRLATQPDGEALVRSLEGGLRAVVLGANPSLASAVANDNPERDMGFAQELLALARPGDVLLGISTSGTARNVRHAVSVAWARGLTTIALTGADGGPLAQQVDIAIRAPAHRTDRVQEQHIALYHCLCEMLEEEFFPGR